MSFRTRILALYAANPNKDHWLWERPLLPMVGELGVKALPILRDALQMSRYAASALPSRRKPPAPKRRLWRNGRTFSPVPPRAFARRRLSAWRAMRKSSHNIE